MKKLILGLAIATVGYFAYKKIKKELNFDDLNFDNIEWDCT